MLTFEAISPPSLSADAFIVPEPLDLSFEGFEEEAFAILGRLREEPHIEQYRAEKEGIKTYITTPFKRFRDDLAVNWVLPNRLDFETERNVFSRLLKNDFGAGGCKHHLWMSFYRPERRRLTDVQISHSLYPDGFETGLFVGGNAKDLLQQAHAEIAARPERFLDLLNPLLADSFWLAYRLGPGEDQRRLVDAPLDALPEDFAKADALWLRTAFSRADVLRWQGELVRHALGAVRLLWPVYRFVLAEDPR